jgi:hypothetical protein
MIYPKTFLSIRQELTKSASDAGDWPWKPSWKGIKGLLLLMARARKALPDEHRGQPIGGKKLLC